MVIDAEDIEFRYRFASREFNALIPLEWTSKITGVFFNDDKLVALPVEKGRYKVHVLLASWPAHNMLPNDGFISEIIHLQLPSDALVTTIKILKALSKKAVFIASDLSPLNLKAGKLLIAFSMNIGCSAVFGWIALNLSDDTGFMSFHLAIDELLSGEGFSV